MNFNDYYVDEKKKPVKDEFTIYKLFKYPNPAEILRIYGYSNFKNEIDSNFDDLMNCGTFRDLLDTATEHNYYIIKVVDEESYAKAVCAYRNKIDSYEIQFKEDLFKEFNVSEEQGELIYDFCFEYTYSLEETYSFFKRIVDLIKDVKNEN